MAEAETDAARRVMSEDPAVKERIYYVGKERSL